MIFLDDLLFNLVTVVVFSSSSIKNTSKTLDYVPEGGMLQYHGFFEVWGILFVLDSFGMLVGMLFS